MFGEFSWWFNAAVLNHKVLNSHSTTGSRTSTSYSELQGSSLKVFITSFSHFWHFLSSRVKFPKGLAETRF